MKTSLNRTSLETQDKILEYIRRENLMPGDKLSSERTLSIALGINRAMIRLALKDLVVTGVIKNVPKTGYFIEKPRICVDRHTFNSFTNLAHSRGLDMKRRLLSLNIKEADKLLGTRLKVPIGTKVVGIERLCVIDGSPLLVEESNIVLERCTNLLNEDLAKGSIYELLDKKCGIKLKRQYIEIVCATIPKRAAELLEVPVGSPMIIERSYAYDEDDTLTEYSELHINAKRYEYEGYLYNTGV